MRCVDPGQGHLSDIMLFCAYPVPLTCLLMPLLAWVSGGQVLWQAPCHRRIKALTPEALGRSMSCSLAMRHAVSVGGDLASTKFMIELISNSSVTSACAPGDEVLRRPPHDQVAQDAVQGDGPAVRGPIAFAMPACSPFSASLGHKHCCLMRHVRKCCSWESRVLAHALSLRAFCRLPGTSAATSTTARAMAHLTLAFLLLNHAC